MISSDFKMLLRKDNFELNLERKRNICPNTFRNDSILKCINSDFLLNEAYFYVTSSSTGDEQ
jgi:hypothetical protein